MQSNNYYRPNSKSLSAHTIIVAKAQCTKTALVLQLITEYFLSLQDRFSNISVNK